MYNPQQTEKEILEFWSINKIYEKSKKKNIKGDKFFFMDGPPYASGYIHLGTALNKILKDIAMRSERLQGKDVFDRPGYDTHGVPIELQVEREIGSKSKQDIEKYGVDKFVKKCREFATKYIEFMNNEFINLGVWMDWKNPYLTFSEEYIEAIWRVFKEADKKGLLYLGKYPVHVCSRCATAVAYNEIEYGKQKDTSIYIKFPLKDRKNVYLIIWTTTPWTLPANTGVMVNPEVFYQEIETSKGERWIIAKELASKIMNMAEKEFSVKKEFKGKDMKGWKYENPVAKYTKIKTNKAYEVVLSARYVTTEDGSGLVHCAPGHGKEDFEVGKENGLDVICPVEVSGLFNHEAGKYSGKQAREANKDIIKDLEEEGVLVHKIDYVHDYPLCWRDKTPLLMISQPQWFLKISDIHNKLLEENESNNWIPSWAKLRMKAWLEGISDWPVSRQRYWGTPLPIWYNKENGEKIVIGSLDELKKLSGKKNIDLHKPGIDDIIIEKNGREFRRVEEVLDVWFDSGVSSWAALGYPKNKLKFKKFWPADLNIEGKDQIRGWWNSQLILSLIAFGKKPFNNILMHGLVLNVDKKKMSKSGGNNIPPKEIIEKYGRDTLRYYFAKFSKGEDFSFDEREMNEVKKVFMILDNVHNFIGQLENSKKKEKLEDKWILSKLNSLVKNATKDYNEFKFNETIQKIENFLIKDLSRTYIQIIRERSGEPKEILEEAREIILKLLAPITPFLTEKIWLNLKEKKIVEEESVHLSKWPKVNEKKIDLDLEEEFEEALNIIEKGLAERDAVQIGLKWPLAQADIFSEKNLGKEMQEIIAKQINVKKIKIIIGKERKVKLDIKITPELEAEGYAREFARNVQSFRKKSGLKKGQSVDLIIFCSEKIKDILERNIHFLKERTNSKKIDFSDDKIGGEKFEFKIKEEKIMINFCNF